MSDRRRRPWEGPEWKDDPEAAADRAAAESGPMTEGEMQAMAARHWRRRADQAAGWHGANPSADTEERERAFSHRVGAEGTAAWFEAGRPQSPEDGQAETLEKMRALYAETANPYFMWRAVSIALHSERPEVPEWCLAPFRASVNMIAILGKPGMPEATPANIAKHLGLSRQGYSAHAMAERQERAWEEAQRAERLHEEGMTLERARVVATEFRVRDPAVLRRRARHKRKAEEKEGKPPEKSDPDPSAA